MLADQKPSLKATEKHHSNEHCSSIWISLFLMPASPPAGEGGRAADFLVAPGPPNLTIRSAFEAAGATHHLKCRVLRAEFTSARLSP